MPDKAGNFKGISIPEIPWHASEFVCPHCDRRYPDPSAPVVDRTISGGGEPWCHCGSGESAGVYLRRPGSPPSSWRLKMVRRDV